VRKLLTTKFSACGKIYRNFGTKTKISFSGIVS